MVDNIAAISARISSIEGRIAQLGLTAPAARPLGIVNDDFGQVLQSSVLQASALHSAFLPSSMLPTSIGHGPGGALTPAERRSPGTYGPLTPPAELVAYGNGQIPPQALVPLANHGHHSLWAPAAHAFDRMEADARAQGVTIGITDSYRPLHSQERLAREKGLYSQGGLAATPGTSNHGWGMSVDLDLDANAQAWMREHGWRYGFVEDVPREPWHWTYRPAGL